MDSQLNQNRSCLTTLGIVTLYNPDVEKATMNILQYLPYIQCLIIWDNSPVDTGVKKSIMKSLKPFKEKIVWKGAGVNFGIAKALNYGFKYAKEYSYKLILTMDQDSKWDNFKSYLDDVLSLLQQGRIEVFTPNISGMDKKEELYIDKYFFITSGTLFPIEVIEKTWDADETFSVDALDVDYSIRVRNEGFHVTTLTKHILDHHIGTPFRSKFFRISTPNYNAKRTYGMARNHIILCKKHWNLLDKSQVIYYIKEYIVYKFVRILLLENDKVFKLKMLFKGIYDGINYDMRSAN